MTGFLLATPGYVLRASGVAEVFAEAVAAASALRSERVPLVVGALPFDPSAATALSAPVDAGFAKSLDVSSLGVLPTVWIEREIPSRAEHVARVTALLDRIAASTLAKVVAARSVVIGSAAPIDPETLVSHLVARHPYAAGYAVDLGPAGRTGETLVGSSPEFLVCRRGDSVTLRPLAGTAPRAADATADEQQAEKLLASEKNRAEHAYVVDWIRERLADACELTFPDGPQLISTPDVWHLATPITGRLRDPATTALDLAMLLHPTPAVCGTPTERALSVIAETEEPRGFYGGAVGWCDATGDGEWIVAIRCAEIAADRRSARAYAGGGIVMGSEPQAELDETTAKLRTLLSPLGVRVV